MNDTKETLNGEMTQPEVADGSGSPTRRASHPRAKKYIPDIRATRIEKQSAEAGESSETPQELATEGCNNERTKSVTKSFSVAKVPAAATLVLEKEEKADADQLEAAAENVTVYGGDVLDARAEEKHEDTPAFIRDMFTDGERAEMAAVRIAERAKHKNTGKRAVIVCGIVIAVLLVLICIAAFLVVVADATSIVSIDSLPTDIGTDGLFIGHYDDYGMVVSGTLYVSPISRITITDEGLSYSSGDRYVGERVNFIRHGKGKMFYASGDTFEGEFTVGAMTLGTYVYASGDSYTGTFKDGKFDGEGSYVFSDGSIYNGSFVGGVPHGEGTHSTSDGDVYIGEFKDGVKSGTGKYTWADGSYYTGIFEDGVPHGNGVMYFASGDSYAGEFLHGVISGEGTYTYADASSYHGEFEDGLPHGKGTLTLANGDVYIGEFQNGEMTGEGSYTWKATGKTVTGRFENGKIVE